MHLTAVRDLVDRPGPFVTVHAEVGRTTEDALQQLDARWTTIRHALEHEHVDDALIEQIGARLHEQPPVGGPARRTLVAEGGEVVFDDIQAGASSWQETVEVDLLPDLSGWLVQATRQIPFVLVVADREGADIGFHTGLAETTHEDVVVDGDDFPITKVPEGDWAQKQYQRSAENTWKRNAGEVADEVRHRIGDHRLVVLAGDERACHDIQEALSGLTVPVVHVTGGGRAAGASEEALWSDVRRVLADFEAHDEQDVVDALLERTGQGAGAARGLDEVLEAFVRGQVERLVVDLDAAREMTVDPADHPGLRLPESVAGEVPADRVLLAAAAATDADVAVLPKEQTKGQGVAALLRWDS